MDHWPIKSLQEKKQRIAVFRKSWVTQPVGVLIGILNGPRRPGAGSLVHSFTLTDLVISVAVVGILVAVGLPSYRSFVAKNNYGIEQGDLSSLQINLENFYNANNRYPSASSVRVPVGSPVNYVYAQSPADSL